MFRIELDTGVKCAVSVNSADACLKEQPSQAWWYARVATALWEVGAGGSGVLDHCRQHSEFQASLDYENGYLKIN